MSVITDKNVLSIDKIIDPQQEAVKGLVWFTSLGLQDTQDAPFVLVAHQ